ncbi:Minor histocompatibility antigen H13, partial [Haplosporangium bisporale]
MAGKYVASPVAIEQGQYVAYAALTTMAIVPIYFGSRASLKKWKNIKDKSATKAGDKSESIEQDDVKSESLSIDDAITFPIFGSLGLVSLHLAYKHWDKTYINYASTAYFVLVGILALAQVGVNTISPIIKMLGLHIEPYHITLSRKARGYYAATKDWIASNIFAVAIALNGIQLLSLDSFKTGMTLIVGFCLYEVGWAKYGADIL